jgi:quinol monooxygenase YgiN/limonene-1,2-epoxide hydrolase
VVVVTGSVRVRADGIEEALRLGLEHVQRSREEPGCLLHSVHRDVEDPMRLVFLEHWTDRDALHAHFAVPASNDFVAALTSLSDEPPQMDVFETSAPPSLQRKRLAVVRRHMEAENELDFDAVIRTFAHPRYELMASGRVFDGEAEVREYFTRSRAVFPDQRNENVELRSLEDGVVAEFDLLGTHAETGHPFRSRMLALFLFEGDRIVCERVYFDRQSVTDH